LEIGFGAKFDKIAQQNALRKVRLEPISAETWTQNYTAFAASRKIEANLVWGTSNLLYLLHRLHKTHKALLKNSCAPPKTGESFMFHKYTALVAQLSLRDKAALVTLLPDIFHWGEMEASTSAVPGRALLAQLPKDVQSTECLKKWLPNINFASNAASSRSTYAESSMDEPIVVSSISNVERQASTGYQEVLTSEIILETLKANTKTGILPRCFGPSPMIDECNIGILRQGESEKTRISK
jgi:hypothetical protein